MTEMATTVLTGPGGEVRIGDEHPFRIIGERINPTGRKQLTEELKVMDMTTVKADAIAQVAAGAAVLDLNAGIPGFDEPAMLSAVVHVLHLVRSRGASHVLQKPHRLPDLARRVLERAGGQGDEAESGTAPDGAAAVA